MTAKELLAAVRAAQGIPSNYRLARLLGLSDNTLQRWNTGANTPDDATAARLATMAGLDPDFAVAAMHAERANDAQERSRWARIAERLQRAGVAACVTLSLGMWSGGPDGGALASTGASGALSALGSSVYYVNYMSGTAPPQGVFRRHTAIQTNG